MKKYIQNVICEDNRDAEGSKVIKIETLKLNNLVFWGFDNKLQFSECFKGGWQNL